MKRFRETCGALLILGGFAAGIRGLIALDVIAWLCGGALTAAARIVYGLLGLAAAGYIAARAKQAPEQAPGQDAQP